MKRFNISKIVGISALALSLATLPTVMSASAQTSGTTDGTATNTTTNTQATDGNYQDGDWGLLGLLGLFGLFGRKNRRRDETGAYGNRDVVSTPGSRSNY